MSSTFPTLVLSSIITITIVTSATYDGWTEVTSPLLPRAISRCAVGYDPSNHTIWMLGGYTPDNNNLPLMSFDYLNNEFKDYGEEWLPTKTLAMSQNYVQIGTILYMIDFYGSHINSFDMYTMLFTTNYVSIPSGTSSDGYRTCMVNIRKEYIAVLNKNSNKILDIESQQWLNNVPSLRNGRMQASCTYINDAMFIIGGYDAGLTHFSSIEYLNVSSTSMVDIASVSWEYTAGSLPQPVKSSRCITVNDDIVVIGGIDETSSNILNTVYIVDSITGSVSVGASLPQAVSNSAVVFVHNIIYNFGGDDTGWVAWNGWQQQKVVTTSPTKNPTDAMTPQPSYTPSQYMKTSSGEETTTLVPPEKTDTTSTSISSETTEIQSEFKESTQVTVSVDEDDNSKNEHHKDGVAVILGVIACIICVILLFCVGIGVWFKKRRKKQQVAVKRSVDLMNVDLDERRQSEGVIRYDHQGITHKYDDEGVHDANNDQEKKTKRTGTVRANTTQQTRGNIAYR